MKYITTKLSTQQISMNDFIEIVHTLHQLNGIEITSYITSFHNGKIYNYDKTIAYQINQNHNYYEYIFDEADNGLYISLDINNNKYFDLIAYLLHKNYLKRDIFSYDQVKIGKLNDMDKIISFIENKTLLPVIYLNQSLNKYSQNLIDSLKSIAYVLSGENHQFDKKFQEHFHLQNNSYIMYLNHEFQKISLLNDENVDSFVVRIQSKIQNYITQRIFPFPYDMKSFQHFIIQKLITNIKENEDKEASHLEIQLSKWEHKKQNLLKEIDDISNKILVLENQNEDLEMLLNQKKNMPLILKGDEKEFYEGEQKDLILSLLKKDFEYTKNSMIAEILKQNPFIGNREKYLDEIFSLLVSDGLSKKNLDLLSHYGINIDYSRKHPSGIFFNNSRYTITFSSTPGDVNAGRKSFRQIKKSFF